MDMLKFRNDLIESIYKGMYQRVEDNFDFARFSHDGVDRSNQVNPIQNARYLEFVIDNLAPFYAASLLLSDEESRDLFRQIIKYRCLGHPHIRIRDSMTWTTVKAWLNKAESYAQRASGLTFDGLRHHVDIPVEGCLVALDAWSGNVAYGLGADGHRQYYFRRGDLEIRPEPGDFVIDGGACFGDTAVFFACSVGDSGKVYAFEPLPAHLEVVRFNVAQNGMADRIQVVPAGVGEKTNNLNAISDALAEVASPGFTMRGLESHVPILAIDDLVKNEGVKSIDFIKLDVEGFELNAIKGAAETIARFKPKLAISLYHKPEDFFEIPLYLKERYPFYRLYLDHYTIFNEETVLYATAD